MSITLSNKERLLLEDQKSHEQTCIEKYTNYANQAKDPQLKQIFQTNAAGEVDHLNSINSLLNGEIPDYNNPSKKTSPADVSNNQPAGMNNVSDEDMCKDMLMTEKYVSGTYDTTVFEFRDTNARDMLNHIQKEEQKHGESIYKYMESKGMYNVQ